MLRIGYSPLLSSEMVRSASPFVVALVVACVGSFRPDAVYAQASPSDLLTRIDRLEASIRDLTGAVEQLQYRNQQLEQQVQRLQEGAASRPDEGKTPPRPQVSAAPPPPTVQYSPPPPPPIIATEPALPPPPEPAPSSNRRGDAFDPNANPTAPGAPRPLGTSTAATEPPPIYERPPTADAQGGAAPAPRQPGAPLDLSNLSGRSPPANEAPPSASPSGAATVAALPPANTPKEEFDIGYGSMQRKDYATAAEAFGTFLHKFPSDRLAPEAQFWLGEALFQSQKYHDAAEAFLAVSTKYDTTARAPDALLRLGQSLAALGEKEAACASLGEVLRKYPRASLNVKQGVDREQKRDHC